MREYDTSEPVTFEAQSAPEVVETVEIEGQPVAIVRLATLTMPTEDATPVFGRTDGFYAMFAGAEVHTLSRTFYLNRGSYHAAGEGTGGRAVASVKGGELSRSTTAKGAIKGARERIEQDRLFAQYAPVALANVASHTRADFEALDADATIEPGDLVVVVSHSKFRTGVAVKVGKTRVECLASTPTGGRANGATRTMGKDVRLLRKATPAAPAEQGEVATAAPAAPAGEETAPAAPASEPVTPRGRWAVGLPPASVPSVDESLAEAAADFRAVRTVAAGEGDHMGRTDVPAAAPASESEERRRVELRDARNDLLDVRGILSPNGSMFPPVPPSISLVPAVAPAVRWLVDELERVRAELAELRSDPVALRAVADQVEQTRAGHVAEVDAAGAIVHKGLGVSGHNMARRDMSESLSWDGGAWQLPAHGSSREIGEHDVAGAQAWAAGVIESRTRVLPYGLVPVGNLPDGADAPAPKVTGWEHHRDDHGDWWEPVTR